MQEKRPEVSTKYGRLRGALSEDGRTAIYRGIPYAAPPVGQYRWRPPRAPESWQGVREAAAFPDICCQESDSNPKSFYNVEFGYLDNPQTQSEDCLYLNVWTPTERAGNPIPVAMWIHGGGFNSGYGHEVEFDGEPYAQRGVILVTINYRLGVFGFFSHPDGVAGNYGLLDQIAALHWIRENIADFGGDPDNVTIFGQSAGAVSVQLLMASPLTEGLFAHAISESGGTMEVLLPHLTAGEEERQGEAELLLREAGVSTVGELRRIPAKQLLRNWVSVKQREEKPQWSLESAREDGVVISSFANPLRDVPLLWGCTEDDAGSDFAMARLLHIAGSICAKQRSAPTYLYYFDRKLPGDRSGAFHSAELWYVFGTLRRSWRPFTEVDECLSEQILDYWSNFMKTGNPSVQGGPEWRPCTAKDPVEMELDEHVGLRPVD